MRKLFTIAAASALAVALGFTATAPSLAAPFHHRHVIHRDSGSAAIGAGIVGGMLGFIAGAAIAGSAQPVYPAPAPAPDWRWRQHERACMRAYGPSYDPRSDTWIDYYGYERRCRL